MLPTITVNDLPKKYVISRECFGVYIHENVNWMYHITLTKDKMSKQLRILYKAKPYLNRKSMVSLYYLFIHKHLSYGNIT